MKRKMVHVLLLLSLFFNIAHAYVIAAAEQCVHETPVEYVLEQSQSNDCGDLCDLHHMFHWSAIVTETPSAPQAHLPPQQPEYYTRLHLITLPKNDTKPPIR